MRLGGIGAHGAQATAKVQFSSLQYGNSGGPLVNLVSDLRARILCFWGLNPSHTHISLQEESWVRNLVTSTQGSPQRPGNQLGTQAGTPWAPHLHGPFPSGQCHCPESVSRWSWAWD